MVSLYRFSIFLLLIMVFDACNSSGSVGYKPPLVPVKFVIAGDGTISVDAEYAIVTPLGEFSIGASIPVNQSDHCYIVTIRDRRKSVDTTDTHYCIHDGQNDYQIVLNNTNAIVGIDANHTTIDITAGDISVIQLNPTNSATLAQSSRTQLSSSSPKTPSVIVSDMPAVSLTGRWDGVFITHGGYAYTYEMLLAQTNNQVQGTTLAVQQRNQANFSYVKIGGIITNTVFQFEEYEIIDGADGIQCLILGELTYRQEGLHEYLTGTWHGVLGGQGCPGSGSIELQKQP